MHLQVGLYGPPQGLVVATMHLQVGKLCMGKKPKLKAPLVRPAWFSSDPQTRRRKIFLIRQWLVTTGYHYVTDLQHVNDRIFPLVLSPQMNFTASNESYSWPDYDDDAANDSSNSMCSIGPDPISQGCRYWIQGVLLSVVGFVGVLGNSVSDYN